MNFAYISGYVQRDPMVSSGGKTKVARFTVASKQGEGPTNYIPVVCFAAQADEAEKLKKDDYVEVRGFLQSGSYEKDGKTVYTFDLNGVRIIPSEAPGRPAEPKKKPAPRKKPAKKPAPKKKPEPKKEDFDLFEDDSDFDDIF